MFTGEKMAKRRRNGGIETRKNKNGTYSYRATFVPGSGLKRVSKTFQTKVEAARWLDEQELLKRRGEWEHPDKIKARKEAEQKAAQYAEQFTVDSLIDTWLKSIQRSRTEATYYTYQTKIRYTRKILGKTPVANLTRDRIENVINRAYIDNKPGAAYEAVTRLRALLLWAKKRGDIDANLTAGITWPTRKEIRKRDQKIITPESIEKLYHAMPKHVAIAIYLGAYCSLRIGEVRGLQRRDIICSSENLLRIRVRRQVSNKARSKVTAPKTAAGVRELAVPKFMEQALLHHLDAYVGQAPEAFIISSSHDSLYPIGESTLRKFFDDARERLGLEWLWFHDLRRSGLTLFAQSGATLGELMARGGHADIDTVRVYQIATKERDQMVTAQMDTLIEQELEPRDNVASLHSA